ncbi:MAG TPA: PfkB family carbohydrate kinase [Mycobacterium sp.]
MHHRRHIGREHDRRLPWGERTADPRGRHDRIGRAGHRRPGVAATGTPESLVRHAARIAAAAGCTVVLNAAPAPASVDGLFDDVDVLVVNEPELTSIANLLSDKPRHRRDGMNLLADTAQSTVICTAGADGAFVAQWGRIEHIPAHPVQAVDATAAGDTFIGYLAAALTTDTDSIPEAVETAVRAAGIAVTRPGAIDAIPHRDEVLCAAATTRGQQ